MEVEKEDEALVVYDVALELHPNKSHVSAPHPRSGKWRQMGANSVA